MGLGSALAKRIVKKHSRTLSLLSHRPASEIYREMVEGELTPREWAISNEIDPYAFEHLAAEVKKWGIERVASPFGSDRWKR